MFKEGFFRSFIQFKDFKRLFRRGLKANVISKIFKDVSMKIITYFKRVSYGCIRHTLRTFQELNIRGVVSQD